MKKSIVCAAAFAFAFTCAVAGVSVSKAANAGPAEMVLKDTGSKPATFAHKAHQDRAKCADCHHSKTADGKKGPYVAGQEKKCSTCHNKDMANAKLNSFKNAAHEACKGCHKAKNGPMKCNDCHKK
ncbi:MAG: cytochrome c family protein [Desulfobulbaceae bacterium]|nr:cytochrome c family protein [Desulfobulbaceae bacterium]